MHENCTGPIFSLFGLIYLLLTQGSVNKFYIICGVAPHYTYISISSVRPSLYSITAPIYISLTEKKMKLSTSCGVSVLVLVFIIFMSSATTDLVVVAAGRAPATGDMAAEADVSCSPLQLSPCLDPIQHDSKPSSICCQKLKEQVPCLCGYIKNPAFKPYVTGPNAQKLSSNCGVPFPRC